MPNGAKLSPSREMEDALMYLPRKGVNDYRKGQIIFDEHQPSKGLHLVVPLMRGPSWDDCVDFSRSLAEELVREAPEAFVAVMSKVRRTGRIFIDYLRNQRGSTSVAAYSTRAKAEAPVSTPLSWDELRPNVESTRYTVANLPLRLASLKADPWAKYAKTRQRLPRRRRRMR